MAKNFDLGANAMGVQTDFGICDIGENETFVCPVCGKSIDKDIKQCPYCKELIWDDKFDENELVETESDKEYFEVEEAKTPLLFMLAIIGLSSAWSIAWEIILAHYDYSTSYSIVRTVFDVALCAYVIIMFLKKKNNAIYMGAVLFALFAISNILEFITINPHFSYLFRSGFDCAWIVFLLTSPGLKRMLPTRKMFWWDWTIVIFCMIILLLAFL